MLNISMRENSGITILDLEGKIILGTGDRKLKEVIDTLLAEDKRNILLNFNGVTYMDSSGIGQLVHSLRTVKADCGQIKIVNVSNKIYKTFDIMKLLPIFEVYSDENEALKSFESLSS
jgi:anti-sigma B factor antagonist